MKKKKTPEDCGQACFGFSTVITYAKTKGRCVPSGCDCFCTYAQVEGKDWCQKVGNVNYDVYILSGELSKTMKLQIYIEDFCIHLCSFS